MRRLLVVAGILLPGLFLSGCGAKDIENNRPVLNFKSDLAISSEKTNLSAKIARTEDNTQLEVTSPESLAGLKISHGEAENSISMNGLEYKTDELVLPSGSSIAAVFEVLAFMAENIDEEPFYKDSEEMAFLGKVTAGKFELRVDGKTRLLTEIKIGDKITAKFSNQEKL